MGIRVKVAEGNVIELLRGIERKGKDLRKVLKDIGTLVESNVQQRFDTKTDPDGVKWRPWSEITKQERAKEGRGTLLAYTGNMRNSLTSSVNGKTVTVGFGVDYAAYHEFGTSNMPARRMLLTRSRQIAKADLEDIYDLIFDYYSKK